jgi:hypothetical protein
MGTDFASLSGLKVEIWVFQVHDRHLGFTTSVMSGSISDRTVEFLDFENMGLPLEF